MSAKLSEHAKFTCFSNAFPAMRFHCDNLCTLQACVRTASPVFPLSANTRRRRCRKCVFSPQKSNYSTEAEESCLHTRVPPEQTEGIEHLSASQRLPQHVAVIMDGNSRWAAQAGLPAALGHQRGVDALRDTVRCCRKWGIKCLTVSWDPSDSKVLFI